MRQSNGSSWGSRNSRGGGQGTRRFNPNNRRSSGGRGRGGNSRRPRAQTIHRSQYINDGAVQAAAEDTYVGLKYTDLNLNSQIEKNLLDKGFETTTKVQEKVIPMILDGKDVLGISATGSGKTAAFLIPMIEKMLNNSNQRLMILSPTRELAQQIEREAVSLLRGTKIYATLVVGGESMNRQIQNLKKDDRFIVGTPGRINDLIKRRIIKTETINNIILDEVDQMLDMGFIGDITFIFDKVAREKQSLFFSATHNKKVEETVESLSGKFELVQLAQNTPSTSVKQDVIDYRHNEEKLELLQKLLQQEEVLKAIIFVDTKRFADKVDKILYDNRFKVGVIHGGKRQNARKKVIEMFKSSKIHFLVATNVAARGVHVDNVSHVINLDEPQTYDEYIHRIGRTGRNGETGTAYTFVKVG